jgi:hypothetical protein
LCSAPQETFATLARHGVLILGEFTEFRGNAVESLLQPLEQRRVDVTRMVGLVRMRTKSDEPVVPDHQATAEGFTVFWEPAHYPADDIEAELPDGTRLTAILQFGGRRVGFERPLPKGTQLLLRGQPAWRRIGETDS